MKYVKFVSFIVMLKTSTLLGYNVNTGEQQQYPQLCQIPQSQQVQDQQQQYQQPQAQQPQQQAQQQQGAPVNKAEDKAAKVEKYRVADYRTYKMLKQALSDALADQYVPDVAAIYVIANLFRQYGVASAAGGGTLIGAGIILAPVTFGCSLIFLLPGVPVCAGGSLFLHKYKKLAHRAKKELALMVDPKVFKEIRKIKKKEGLKSSLLDLRRILAREGYDISQMVTYKN